MDKPTCTIDGCGKPVTARGWCGMHYRRWQRSGDPLKLRRPAARFCPRCKSVELPRGGDAQPYCAPCHAEYRRERRALLYAQTPDPCVECGGIIPYRWAGKRYCSHECKMRANRRRLGLMVDRTERLCAHGGCSAMFTPSRSTHNYCSSRCGLAAIHTRRMADPEWKRNNRERAKEWLKRNPWYRAVANGTRRARLREVTFVKVTSNDLESRFIANAGLCWMCGGEADCWDHVKPIVAGGAHMLANLRPACTPCNSSKGGKWSGARALHSV